MKSSFRNEMFYEIEKITSAIPGNFYWKDKQGYYLGCNSSLLQTLGFESAVEMVGKTDYDLWAAQAKGLLENDKKVMATGKLLSLQESVKIENKEKMYFAVVKKPLRDKKGNILGIIGNSVDITELKIAQFAKKEAAKRKLEKPLSFRKFHRQYNLTTREAECVYHTVRGMSAKQIARIMGLSNRTVESYLNNAKFKLNCKSKQELILKVFEDGIV